MILGTASSVARLSSSARTRNASRSSSRESVRTRTPRFGHELDEPERGQTPQRLAHGRAADLVLLGELLLAEDRPRRDLAGDDRLLEREREIVGLGADRGHAVM